MTPALPSLAVIWFAWPRFPLLTRRADANRLLIPLPCPLCPVQYVCSRALCQLAACAADISNDACKCSEGDAFKLYNRFSSNVSCHVAAVVDGGLRCALLCLGTEDIVGVG